MPLDIFYKLYNHYQKTGENHLDVYTYTQYILWEIESGGNKYLHNYEKCNSYSEYVSIVRRLKLYSVDDLRDIRIYIKTKRKQYSDYLFHLSNEPRRKACIFTAKREVKEYIYNKYGKKCLKCGTEHNISLDHVIPVHKGGKDEVNNLQPLCKSCNSQKGTDIIDYRS